MKDFINFIIRNYMTGGVLIPPIIYIIILIILTVTVRSEYHWFILLTPAVLVATIIIKTIFLLIILLRKIFFGERPSNNIPGTNSVLEVTGHQSRGRWFWVCLLVACALLAAVERIL